MTNRPDLFQDTESEDLEGSEDSEPWGPSDCKIAYIFKGDKQNVGKEAIDEMYCVP